MAKHVKATGTNGDGSESSPWVGFANVNWGTAGTDGTLYVRGTFGDTMTVGNNGGNPLRIRGDWPGEPGVIAATAGAGVVVYGTRSNIYLSDMEIYGCGNNAIYWQGPGGTIDNVHAHDVVGNYAVLGIGDGATTLKVKNCILHGTNTDGIAVEADYAGTLIFEDNVVYDVDNAASAGDCFQMESQAGVTANLVMRRNTFTYDSTSKQNVIVMVAGTVLIEDNAFTSTAGKDALKVKGASSAVIAKNTLSTTGTGSALGLFSAADFPLTACNVYGNVLSATSGYGIWCQQDNDHGASTTTLYNNTVTQSDYALYLAKATGLSGAYTVTAYNNKLTGTTKSIHKSDAASTLTVNYNYTPATAAASGANDVTTEAACAGAGVWLAGVRAYDDLPLPLSPDIGAVQDRNAAGRRFGTGGGTL